MCLSLCLISHVLSSRNTKLFVSSNTATELRTFDTSVRSYQVSYLMSNQLAINKIIRSLTDEQHYGILRSSLTHPTQTILPLSDHQPLINETRIHCGHRKQWLELAMSHPNGYNHWVRSIIVHPIFSDCDFWSPGLNIKDCKALLLGNRLPFYTVYCYCMTVSAPAPLCTLQAWYWLLYPFHLKFS